MLPKVPQPARAILHQSQLPLIADTDQVQLTTEVQAAHPQEVTLQVLHHDPATHLHKAVAVVTEVAEAVTEVVEVQVAASGAVDHQEVQEVRHPLLHPEEGDNECY